MKKRKNIFYWIFTIWMSLGMVSSAIVQLLGTKEEMILFKSLEYPAYLMILLGVWKIIGVIVALAPKLPVLKEWAYAGFVFAMSGALFSHIVCKHPFNEVFPSVLLLVLTALSWYLRPESRKVVSVA